MQLEYTVERVTDFPAEANALDAAIRFDADGRRAEIWVRNASYELELKDVVTRAAKQSGPRDRTDDETFVLRTVERLRAYVQAPVSSNRAVRSEPSGAPTNAVEAPTSPSPTPTPSRASRSADIFAGFSGAAPSGALGASLYLTLSARAWLVRDRLAVGIVGHVPLVPSDVSNGVGSATVSTLMSGIEGYVRITPIAWSFEAGPTAGVLAAWARMSGRADAPYRGQDDSLWTSIPFVGFHASHRVGARLRLQAGLMAGVSAPRAAVTFSGERVAVLGEPLLMGSLGFVVMP